MRDEAQQLKVFLTAARKRISPGSKGLPTRLRAEGLRREDIAELLGVTPLWYALFESGTSRRRFSLSFLERVSDVLSLTSREHQTLARLVIANGMASRELYEQTTSRQLVHALSSLAELAHGLSNASSLDEAGVTVSQFVRCLLDCIDAKFHLLVASRATAHPEQERSIPNMPDGTAGSAVNIPLVKDGQIVASLYVSSPFANAFCDADVQVLEVVAAQLSKNVTSFRAQHTCEAIVCTV